MLIAQRLVPCEVQANEALELTFAQREKSHFRALLASGEDLGITLKSGTLLKHGDKLALSDGRIAEVIAASESVLEVRAASAQKLAAIAYHVGNRHVPLEVGDGVLRLLPDHVLQEMIERLGGVVLPAQARFNPESGAYGHSHVHHSHDDLGHGGKIHAGLQPRTAHHEHDPR